MSDIHNEELAAFVTSTLNAISVGIADSKAVGERDYVLNGQVDFEVAVTATKAKEGGGGFKIQVFSAEGKLSAEDSNVSRIRFSVSANQRMSPLNTSRLSRGNV